VFKTVLIANRGEIALRVARACRELGVRAVAVHSTADRDSAVVRFADDAVQIGPAAPRRSYLDAAAVIEAARMSGADAIHPGYGFLSEDPDFAEVCEDNGLVLIGPPAPVMRRLGDKAMARSLMAEAGLPLLPGSREPLENVHDAAVLAADIGFPVIIKAVAGGGGRGMRVVEDPGEFAAAYAETRATAQAVFGDGRVYVERYLTSARHVEVQILADSFGTIVDLGERDCSVQRRHQKLIEETPAPGIPREIAERMGRAAVAGARAAGYVGAGTFEFLLDPSGNFYFMEVNCRIQVEHPVTEMVTGVDLVWEQLRVACGMPLDLTPDDMTPRGVSLECRINAEDPARGFMPAPGRLDECVLPAGPFVRVDSHAYHGYQVPAVYDSLLAKVVVWAPDRPRAISRMLRALDEFRLRGPGIHTTASFIRSVLQDPRFVRVEHDTSLVSRLMAE
jgi:acetyl-CoA carboxylase biotin carboxylase subunit